MRIVSRAGIGGSVVAAGTTVFYLVIISSQGDERVAVAPWAMTLGSCAILGAVASYVESPRSRSLLFAANAGTMLGVGFLAIFSIGMLLILAGVLFALAASSAAPPGRLRDFVLPWVVGTVACVAIPAALLVIT